MLVRKDNLSVEQLLTSLHGVKLAIFDPLFCEQKIKSQLPLLIASNAIVGSYNDQKQIINEYLNKKDRISPIPERFLIFTVFKW